MNLNIYYGKVKASNLLSMRLCAYIIPYAFSILFIGLLCGIYVYTREVYPAFFIAIAFTIMSLEFTVIFILGYLVFPDYLLSRSRWNVLRKFVSLFNPKPNLRIINLYIIKSKTCLYLYVISLLTVFPFLFILYPVVVYLLFRDGLSIEMFTINVGAYLLVYTPFVVYVYFPILVKIMSIYRKKSNVYNCLGNKKEINYGSKIP